MAANLTTTSQADVEAMRSALFARQASGEAVPEADWDRVAAAQRALNATTFDSRGMFRTRVY